MEGVRPDHVALSVCTLIIAGLGDIAANTHGPRGADAMSSGEVGFVATRGRVI